MKRKITLFFSLPFFVGGLLAQPMTPAQHMAMSAQATAAAQQHAQQQALAGQIAHNRATCGRDYCGYSNSAAVRSRPPADAYFDGLHDGYGGIAISFNDDILRDNYGNPRPFSWDAYRKHTSEIDGKRLEDLSVFGGYMPMEIHFAGSMRQSLHSAEEVAADLQAQCGARGCQPLLIYANSCPAIAVGWLKDYSGQRIYASTDKQTDTLRLKQGQSHEFGTAYPLMQVSREEALSRCQSDPAVNAASCEAPEDQTDICAMPRDIIGWR